MSRGGKYQSLSRQKRLMMLTTSGQRPFRLLSLRRQQLQHLAPLACQSHQKFGLHHRQCLRLVRLLTQQEHQQHKLTHHLRLQLKHQPPILRRRKRSQRRGRRQRRRTKRSKMWPRRCPLPPSLQTGRRSRLLCSITFQRRHFRVWLLIPGAKMRPQIQRLPARPAKVRERSLQCRRQRVPGNLSPLQGSLRLKSPRPQIFRPLRQV
mmetsp:Transcript_17807/g.41320  ORF Transcript_17807/g.41320 Transcript_17807/m.41320 type:complete len:207 (+) Transcript_17807:951-1571(+)